NGSGCSLPGSEPHASTTGGTATNGDREEARILTDLAMTNKYGIRVGAGNHGEYIRELTDDQEAVVRHWLLTVLTKSASARGAFGTLLMHNTAILPGGTTLLLSDSVNDTQVRSSKTGMRTVEIQFNPNYTGRVWSGGFFQAGKQPGAGVSTLRETTPDQGLVHELYHAYLWMSGKQLTVREHEIEATRF